MDTCSMEYVAFEIIRAASWIGEDFCYPSLMMTHKFAQERNRVWQLVDGFQG